MKKILILLMTVIGVSVGNHATNKNERIDHIETTHVEKKQANNLISYEPVNPHYDGLHYSTFPIKYVWTGHESTDTFDLVFFDDFVNVIGRFEGLSATEHTLIPDTDYEVENEFIGLFDAVEDKYSIMVIGYSEGAIAPTYYSEMVHYDKPMTFLGREYRSEYYRNAFEQQYFFEEKTATHLNFFKDGELQDWHPYNTRRLRTATIDNKYVVLSPRRTGAGLAYIEYDFDWEFEVVKIDLGLWSDSELLRASDCTALLQCRGRNGDWVTVLDLLNDIQLPTDKDNLKSYILDLPHHIIDEERGYYEVSSSLRIITTAPAVGSSKNTGRLVVGDISVFHGY